MANNWNPYISGTTVTYTQVNAGYVTYIANNNWIRYVEAAPKPTPKEEYFATLITEDDEDS